MDDNARIELREDETKNSDARPVAIVSDELKNILIAWREQTRKEYPNAETFFHMDGERLGDWKKAWEGALLRCGLRTKEEKTGKWVNAVIFYDTRRTARTRLDEMGVSQEDAKLQMGHKTDAMSERYNQSKKGIERIREAARAKASKPTIQPPTVAPGPSGDVVAQLREAGEMLTAGLLSKAEFGKLKKMLLA